MFSHTFNAPIKKTPVVASTPIDFAILSALTEEQAYYRAIFASLPHTIANVGDFTFPVYEYQNKRILLATTGLGTTFATMVVTLIHTHFSPSIMFFTGTAGGIQAGLNIGDVVIAEKAFEAEIQGMFSAVTGTPFEICLTHPLNQQAFPAIYQADETLCTMAREMIAGAQLDGKKCHTGTVVTSNTFPAPLELFQRIKAAHPLSIDMETSALYQAAWLLGARAIAIRGVSNQLNAFGEDPDVNLSDVDGSAANAAKVTMQLIDALMIKEALNHQNTSKINITTAKEIQSIISKFKLERHVEGGAYARLYQSEDTVHSTDEHRYQNETRSAGTLIYYLLQGEEFSAWHKLKSDELWHYHKGSSIKLYQLNANGVLTVSMLGDPFIQGDAAFQVIIPAGVWFAAELVDKSAYGLVTCSVNPGFEYRDFILADRDDLTAIFPQHADLIQRLTRTKMEVQYRLTPA